MRLGHRLFPVSCFTWGLLSRGHSLARYPVLWRDTGFFGEIPWRFVARYLRCGEMSCILWRDTLFVARQSSPAPFEMSRPSDAVIAQQEAAIEALLRQYPDGASFSDLVRAVPEAVGRKLPERTLARRLARLIATGRATSKGAARSTRYYAASPPAVSAAKVASAGQATVPSQQERPVEPAARSREAEMGLDSVPAAHAEKTPPEPEYVPLSPEATEVWVLMQRPLMERTPVGYDRDFLESYVPGETWYLPAQTRKRLHEIGRSPDPQRPAGTYARDILGYLLIDLAWASSKLEGNTYSRLDTQNLIEFNERAEGADALDALMILNHKSALEGLVEDADSIAFNRYTICGLHARLSENLLNNPADEGGVRTRPVAITGTTYTPTGIPQVIEDCFDTLLRKATAIPDPFEQAFFVMVHIPYLQPFSDVNKRTSRLAANIPFIKGNLCPLSFIDVPEKAYVEGLLAVYELRRVELLRDVFEWAYERSCAQYKVVRDAVPAPDPIRRRYRSELGELVRKTVLAGEPPRKAALHAWAASHGVKDEDSDAFTERALELLVNLNEGSAARYRLTPSEFEQWRSRFAPPVKA